MASADDRLTKARGRNSTPVISAGPSPVQSVTLVGALLVALVFLFFGLGADVTSTSQETPVFANEVLVGPPQPSAPGLPVLVAAPPPSVPAGLDAQPVPMPVNPSEPYPLTPQPDFVPFFGDSMPGVGFLLALIVLLVLWPRLKKAIDATTRKGSIESSAAREKELLRAIERRGGEITPIRAALETRLTVEEADRMLSDLATKGHLQVRATDGRLVYIL